MEQSSTICSSLSADTCTCGGDKTRCRPTAEQNIQETIPHGNDRKTMITWVVSGTH